MKMLLPIRSLVFIALSLSLGGTITRGFYNPTQGRWLNRDPLEERDGANLYRFVSNRPVSASDMLGLWELRCRYLHGLGVLTFLQHCWVECDGHSYSLLNRDGIATKEPDATDDLGEGRIESAGPGGCSCIEDWFYANTDTYAYDPDQCNSNYFANQLLRCCGIRVTQPVGAWGWSKCNDSSKAFECHNCHAW